MSELDMLRWDTEQKGIMLRNAASQRQKHWEKVWEGNHLTCQSLVTAYVLIQSSSLNTWLQARGRGNYPTPKIHDWLDFWYHLIRIWEILTVVSYESKGSEKATYEGKSCFIRWCPRVLIQRQILNTHMVLGFLFIEKLSNFGPSYNIKIITSYKTLTTLIVVIFELPYDIKIVKLTNTYPLMVKWAVYLWGYPPSITIILPISIELIAGRYPSPNYNLTNQKLIIV